MLTPVHISFRLTRAEALALSEWHAATRPQHTEARFGQVTWQALVLAVIALTIPWGRLSVASRWIAVPALVVGGVAFIFASYHSYSRRMAEAALRSEDSHPTPGMFEERRITFDETGVQVESSVGALRLQWAGLTAYELIDDFLILCSGRNPIVAIPRRSIDPDDLDRILHWCRMRVANAA